MANPVLISEVNSPHPYHSRIIGAATIGAAGAPTLVRTAGGIFKSIARTGPGQYDVTLAEAWPVDVAAAQSLQIVPTLVAGATAPTDGTIVNVGSEQINNTTTPKFSIICRTANGTAAVADPVAGAVLKWSFDATPVVP